MNSGGNTPATRRGKDRFRAQPCGRMADGLDLPAFVFVLLVGTTRDEAFRAAVTALPGAPDRPADAGEGGGLFGAFLGTVALTVTSPATILSFAGVIAALGPAGAGGGFVLVVGVVPGSAAWWLGLSLAVGRLRARVTPGAMRAINRISALVLAGFAAAALASTILNS